MLKLKKYQIGDEVKTNSNDTYKVILIYKGYIIAKSEYDYILIKTYSNEVYYNNVEIYKRGLNTEEEIKEYIADVTKGNILLDKGRCTSTNLILKESCFEYRDKQEQIRIKD